MGRDIDNRATVYFNQRRHNLDRCQYAERRLDRCRVFKQRHGDSSRHRQRDNIYNYQLRIKLDDSRHAGGIMVKPCLFCGWNSTSRSFDRFRGY